MENKDIILSGKEITKSYGDNVVLQGINLELYTGDFTVIMGSSGSGKSTLLYALSGMDSPDGGKLCYRGQDITNASEKELTKLRAEDFSFVFQRIHLVSSLTLKENISSPVPFAVSNVPFLQPELKKGLLSIHFIVFLFYQFIPFS